MKIDDSRQESDGLPFCRTIWTSDSYDEDIHMEEPSEKIENINVFWFNNEYLKDVYVNYG